MQGHDTVLHLLGAGGQDADLTTQVLSGTGEAMGRAGDGGIVKQRTDAVPGHSRSTKPDTASGA
jgi:hypothetical protein